MYQGTIGETSSNDVNTYVLAYQSGTVTVSNLSTSTGTLSYQLNLASGAAGTIAASGSQTFTSGAYLTNAGGISNVQITGAGY